MDEKVAILYHSIYCFSLGLDISPAQRHGRGSYPGFVDTIPKLIWPAFRTPSG
jgi:hypothetical protein